MAKKDKLTIEIEDQEKIRNIETLKLQDLINKKVKRDLIPLAKSYLGKYFKYRNGFGGLSAKWWMYIKILRIKGLTIHYISFEKTCDNNIEFQADSKAIIWKAVVPFDGDYIEITKEEFDAAKKVILQEIKKY